MYQYKNFCYSEKIQVFTAMSADCPVAFNDGSLVSCTPDVNGFTLERSGFTAVHHSPNVVDCTLDVAQVSELVALVWGVLIIAVGIQYMKRPIR